MKSIKAKLIVSNVLLGVLTILLVGVTIAYFTDSRQISNTLTSGNVKIMLSEAAVKPDGAGNLIEDANAPRYFGGIDETSHDYGVIYPGQTIFKDPTIQNTGSNEAWIAAKVTLTDGAGDIHKLMGYEGYHEIDIEMLLSGGLLDESVHVGTWNGIEDVCYNDRYAMVQVSDVAEGKYEFYFFFLSTYEQGQSEMLFNHVNISDEWNNEAMQELRELKIDIRAFASQTQSMESCFDAMTKAFPEYFIF